MKTFFQNKFTLKVVNAITIVVLLISYLFLWILQPLLMIVAHVSLILLTCASVELFEKTYDEFNGDDYEIG